MTFIRPLFGAIAATFITTVAAQADTLAVYTHDYGIGMYDPMGSDVLGADWVTISDNSTQRFSDSFDFSSLAYETIDRFILTLDFSFAGPALFPSELWSVRVQGSNTGSAGDDLFVPLVDLLSPQPTFVGPLTDFLSGGDAFAHSVATEEFEFWFSESTSAFLGADNFRLASATLQIEGTPAPVPLPAAGFMLLGALGGVAGLRKMRK